MQYPVTKQEKLRALDRATELLRAEVGERVGGVELLALRLVREQVLEAPE